MKCTKLAIILRPSAIVSGSADSGLTAPIKRRQSPKRKKIIKKNTKTSYESIEKDA